MIFEPEQNIILYFKEKAGASSIKMELVTGMRQEGGRSATLIPMEVPYSHYYAEYKSGSDAVRAIAGPELDKGELKDVRDSLPAMLSSINEAFFVGGPNSWVNGEESKVDEWLIKRDLTMGEFAEKLRERLGHMKLPDVR
jgi:hypothetical protein